MCYTIVELSFWEFFVLSLIGCLFLIFAIFRVHHDDVDDTSMTYGTRHNDKKPKDGSDIYGSSSQDAGDEPNSSQAAPAPAPPKKGTQVLINFASDQVRFHIFSDGL